MTFHLSSKTRKIMVWGVVVLVVIVAGWFAMKVMAVDGEMSLDEKMAYVLGWGAYDDEEGADSTSEGTEASANTEEVHEEKVIEESILDLTPVTNAPTSNCTVKFGNLMLVNPNFRVEDSFIAARSREMISLSTTYGIQELNAWNGDNLMDAEAATHLNDMLAAYRNDYPGHNMQTVSCFRSVGTSCGRLCMATGESDHHTGMSCDLIDAVYGTSLDTDTYDQHVDWQWLHDNSYKYGFINRFPDEWTGGPMSEPMNIDANGTTGLLETWHYRYVGVTAATEIASGKYNDGQYDSLEHYLKARGLVTDLLAGTCK